MSSNDDMLDHLVNNAKTDPSGAPLKDKMFKVKPGGEPVHNTLHKNNHYFFFPPATIGRYPDLDANNKPKASLSVKVQWDKPGQFDFDAKHHETQMDDGVYFMSDGTVVITLPKDGSKIEIVTFKNPGDTGLNYKC